MGIQVSAFAKINLSLDVISKMEDGYHKMLMVMQSVELHDDISLSPRSDGQIRVKTDLGYLPNDERNTAAKAAAAFFRITGISGRGADIAIKKRIPVCAGLGGGSTDGAAVLRGLDEMYDTQIGRGALEKIGATIGSDVPFCVAGGTSLVGGRGEQLHDIDPLPDCRIVICKPAFSVSTPVLFSKIRCDRAHCRPDTDGIVGALQKNDLGGVARRMYNVFEDVLPKGMAEIAGIKEQLIELGALGAVMTGTGSAVFGLFGSEKAAKSAYEAMQRSYSDCVLTAPKARICI